MAGIQFEDPIIHFRWRLGTRDYHKPQRFKIASMTFAWGGSMNDTTAVWLSHLEQESGSTS